MDNTDLPIKFFEYTDGRPGPYCGMHWHEHLEMIYVMKGKISTHCNGDTFLCEEGDIILINSSELHGYSLVETPIHLFCVLMDLSLLQSRFITQYESMYLAPIFNNNILFHNKIKNDDMIKKYFEMLIKENKGKKTGYEFAIKSALYGIICQLMRNNIKQLLSPTEDQSKKRNLKNINKVIDYIEINYSEPIDLDVMANILGVTKYYFCRFFKEMTGSTPIDYLNNYRIHKSTMMLTETNANIIDIAMSVGFNDSNYYSKVFKSIIGMTPSQYRRKTAVNKAK